jgi:hypothetical protein
MDSSKEGRRKELERRRTLMGQSMLGNGEKGGRMGKE